MPPLSTPSPASPNPPSADLHDYTLQRLLHWKSSGNKLGGHPFVQDGALARAMLLGTQRDLRQLTEFDGNLSFSGSNRKFQSIFGYLTHLRHPGWKVGPAAPSAIFSDTFCG